MKPPIETPQTKPTMLFLTILLALLADLTFATPILKPTTDPVIKRCTSPIENTPWILSNFTAFTASPPSSSSNKSAQQSYITFHFTDANPGLQIDTDCAYHLPSPLNSTKHAALDDGSFHMCANQTVAFAYSREGVEVQRVYQDDCLGSYPYNIAKAVGRSGLHTVNESSAAGETRRQAEVEIGITEMA